MIFALLASLACLSVYLFQDGVMGCMDGDRYVSGLPQPSPFSRRFCGWYPRVLIGSTWVSFVALGVLMGGWQGALLLLALPGAWFCATHPTTVDLPCMLCAVLAGKYFHAYPYPSLLLALVAGFIHERGPVFAALYGWHPALLLGLAASGWWRRAARPDDQHVPVSFLGAVRAHRPYQDFLDARVTALGLRGLLVLPICASSLGLRGAATFAVAFASRAVATDSGRMLFWAAPALIVGLPQVPPWMIALHVLTFRRCI